MNKKLEIYVEQLFASHRQTEEIKDLKEEILSNLEAKVEDHIREGLSEEKATEAAIRNMDSVDFLIPDVSQIYKNKYKMELVQSSLIYVLLIWILAIPLRLMPEGEIIHTIISFFVVGFGTYFFFQFIKDDRNNSQEIGRIHPVTLANVRKAAWILWGLYALASMLFTTAVRFGSSIWFHRAVRIDGPYQFAVIAVAYLKPLLFIVLPIIASKAYKLVDKYEVRDSL